MADPGPCPYTVHAALAYIGRILRELPAIPSALLTVTEVAGRLKVNRDKVLGWIAYGRLKAVNMAKSQLGRPRWRIRLADFLAGRKA